VCDSSYCLTKLRTVLNGYALQTAYEEERNWLIEKYTKAYVLSDIDISIISYFKHIHTVNI